MNPFTIPKASRATLCSNILPLRILSIGIVLHILSYSASAGYNVPDGIPSSGPAKASVFPSQSTVAESGGVSGKFNFQLSSSVGQLTHLSFQISGTAQNGVDFQLLGGQVTIPASQRQAVVTLNPISDVLPEGAETVILTITNSDNPSVSIGYQNTATISIVDGATVPVDALDLWANQISGQTNHLFAVAYGLGLYVAVGDAGLLLTSSDAVTWIPRSSGTTAVLNSAVFANGVFVVVGDSGTILTSTNGTNWTKRTSGTTDFLYDVSYGKGVFLTVSDTGTILTSPNGTSWTRRATGPQYVFGVAYGNNRFVAVGGSSGCFLGLCYDNCIGSVSSDGLTWTQSNPALNVTLSDVAFGNGLFVAVGEAGAILTSVDGSSWTYRFSGSNAYLYNIAFGGGTFAVVGAAGTILTSTNGIDWTSRRGLTSPELYNVAYGNGIFVAVGNTGATLQSHYIGPPILATPRLLQNGTIELPVVGRLQQSYRLQSTPSLSPLNWTDVANFIQSDTTNNVVDAGGTNFSSRFYRVVQAF